MHCHMELIMPNVENVEAEVEKILAPFTEEDEDGDYSQHGFYDWYVIGGRFSGAKLEALLGKEEIESFCKVLKDEGITVSGLQRGKPTLSPADQADKVNTLWNATFPESPVKECPLFDNYNESFLDIALLKDLPKNLSAYRVLFAGEGYDGELEGRGMYQEKFWNGMNYETTEWDGLVSSAIEKYLESLKFLTDKKKKKRVPTDDWICVTVDYHS